MICLFYYNVTHFTESPALSPLSASLGQRTCEPTSAEGRSRDSALLFFANFSRFFTDFIRRWLALLRRQDVVFYRRSQLFSLPIPTRIRILPLSLCLWTRISHFTVEHKRCIGSSKVSPEDLCSSF